MKVIRLVVAPTASVVEVKDRNAAVRSEVIDCGLKGRRGPPERETAPETGRGDRCVQMSHMMDADVFVGHID